MNSPCKECIVSAMCEEGCDILELFIKDSLKPLKFHSQVIKHMSESFREETMRTDVTNPSCGMGVVESKGVYNFPWSDDQNTEYIYLSINRSVINVYFQDFKGKEGMTLINTISLREISND